MRPHSVAMRVGIATVGVWMLTVALAHGHLAGGSFRLDTAQEVPPPSGATIAGGTATLQLVQVAAPGAGIEFSLVYDVAVQNLTGTPTAAHIHAGAAGATGPPVHTLTFTSTAPSGGTLAGEVTGLDFDDVETLLAERWYVNVHTEQNPQGEVRGQIRLIGTCRCGGVTRTDAKAFRRCVKTETRESYRRRDVKRWATDKAERKRALGYLKRAKLIARKSACGPAKVQLTSTCCLQVDALGLLAGPPCAPVKHERQCAKLGGSFQADALCTVTSNPCEVDVATPTGLRPRPRP